jgi:chemotaxis protein methyltransferase CheR
MTIFRDQLSSLQNACAFAEAIVATVREPLVVLDQDLRVVAASRSFYSRFEVDADNTEGRLLYELGDGQWDIPKLRVLLEKIIPERGVIEDYEVQHEFPNIGHRTMLLNARRVLHEDSARMNILLGIEDVTDRRILEREKDELLRQKDVLLGEIQHRIANSLQIIASIILLKAKTVDSDETRQHLHDAHKRVISIATVQKHLHSSAAAGAVDVIPYLSELCQALAGSMIGDKSQISLNVGGKGGPLTSQNAESIGLVTTELVINSLKHAFNGDTRDGKIAVVFDGSGPDWTLSVTDNGKGTSKGVFNKAKAGLGSGIVKALAKQLDARLTTTSGAEGTSVSLIHDAAVQTKDVKAA